MIRTDRRPICGAAARASECLLKARGAPREVAGGGAAGRQRIFDSRWSQSPERSAGD
ncbi:hypothetical protein BN903_381 [Halorubrum sp. AJ67]|nr:hypothetical protein BN903_381 [Halorubrum sp. AJ67]